MAHNFEARLIEDGKACDHIWYIIMITVLRRVRILYFMFPVLCCKFFYSFWVHFFWNFFFHQVASRLSWSEGLESWILDWSFTTGPAFDSYYGQQVQMRRQSNPHLSLFRKIKNVTWFCNILERAIFLVRVSFPNETRGVDEQKTMPLWTKQVTSFNRWTWDIFFGRKFSFFGQISSDLLGLWTCKSQTLEDCRTRYVWLI